MSDALSLSVITPSYNQVAFVERTILSVLGQNVAELEFVVVDGGSTDGTIEILERYAGRLWYRSERDNGQADAINKGIALTSGDIICWLNSDDIYYPGALAAVRSYFDEHPEVDVVYGNADHIDEQDRILDPYPCEPWDPQRLHDVCFLCQPAVFFRRRAVDRFGALDAGLNYCMDYEFWLRLAAQGARFAYLPCTLAGSRMYPSNKTLGQRVRSHAEINDMLRRRLGAVPGRWLSNYAHVLLDERGVSRTRGRLKFALAVSVATWWASLRWNRQVSTQLRRLTWAWLRDGMRARADAAPAAPPEQAPGNSPRRRLRIGFDISQTGTRKAGCGQLTCGLAEGIQELGTSHDFLLYPTFGDAVWDPAGPDATWHPRAANFRRWASHPSQSAAGAFWQSPPADVESVLGDPDIVHSHNFFCPVGLTRARLVYTLYDLSFLVHPGWTTESNRQVCFEGVLKASLHADFVIAISEASRQHFLRTFPHYPHDRTAVVYPASRFGSRTPVRRPRHCHRLAPAGFLLSVGTLEPRKNLQRLLSAYAGYVRQTPQPLPLVLAGGKGWLMDGFEQQIRDVALGSPVIRLGYVDDPTLQWLYQNCRAFLYPSLFEGFGLPVVEAMSQGAAVVTSNTTSLPEVAGDAALYVNPEATEDIEKALIRIAGDDQLRRQLAEAALQQAACFSWLAAAERTIECYERVMSLPRRAAARGELETIADLFTHAAAATSAAVPNRYAAR